jgi:CheY-like chemotaxis protein
MSRTDPHYSGAVEILLVEDNPQDAELTRRVLKERLLTNRLVWVKDGAEALEFIFGSSGDPTAPLNQPPRVVLLDLKLPKVDGHEVLRRLKADPRTRTIPVVVLTSSAEEVDIARSYETGANSYIVKPVGFENFAEAVQQLGLYWVLFNRPPENRASAGEER